LCGSRALSGESFSNLTQDHIDFHQDMESYFRAKARLFLEVPRSDKAAVINADDPWGQRLLELCPEALSYGLGEGTAGRRHLAGRILSSSTAGLHLGMALEGRKWEVRSPLVGRFNASNLLAVQALCLELGADPADFRHLENFYGVPGRLERISNERGLDVFVDYAHTPDALMNVLKALRDAGFQRIITVFGCGGNRDRAKRPLMGQAVAAGSDVAVLTSDNPRHEDPEAIIADVLPGLKQARRLVVEADRRKATLAGLKLLRPGDALLVAGKGHESYQQIGAVKHPYSDQQTLRELLRCA
ncbi:MAG: UDP-N-acetylmuramoyl-L-alanyl-D-glutamate--2,6-diaminopimelate ligase, partial [Desulfovibrionaceae bacterium]|nr:UDP-N-acetylmuramoyl-L-alanyl-D-glutamate--2,6-diaminopimelate ligase [Desulfovibrionaceae bacterium]